MVKNNFDWLLEKELQKNREEKDKKYQQIELELPLEEIYIEKPQPDNNNDDESPNVIIIQF